MFTPGIDIWTREAVTAYDARTAKVRSVRTLRHGAVANAIDINLVRVFVADEKGRPVPGKSVVLQGEKGVRVDDVVLTYDSVISNPVQPGSGKVVRVTNAAGEIIVPVTSTVSGGSGWTGATVQGQPFVSQGGVDYAYLSFEPDTSPALLQRFTAVPPLQLEVLTMRVNLIKTNFTAGEISPRLMGRVDIARYANGAKRIENAVCVIQGGVMRRPGSRFVATAKFPDKKARLIPYVFNRAQAYMLECGDGYMRIFQNGAQLVKSDGTPYEIRDFNPLLKNQPDDFIDSGAGAISATPVRIGKLVGIPTGRLRENWQLSDGDHMVEVDY